MSSSTTQAEKFIITLSAKGLQAKHCTQVENLIKEHRGLVTHKKCLTKHTLETTEAMPESTPTPHIVCYEYAFNIAHESTGVITNTTQEASQTELTLRSACLELATKLAVDVSIQADNAYRNKRKLVCFDMDSTLIEQEVIVELAKKAGIGDKVVEITESAMRGEIDFTESFTKRLALLEGLSTDVLDDISHNLSITEGAKELISTLNALGYHTVLISGGFTYFARYLQEQLGLDEIYANELDIADGKVTGKVVLPIVDAQKKAEILQNISNKLNIELAQTVAVGDGANDLPMLALAGLGVAFRAKPLVKQSAKQSISNLGLNGVLYLLGIDHTTQKNLKN